ncbi:hypothetical protein [Streptomyces sp. NPDC003719]
MTPLPGEPSSAHQDEAGNVTAVGDSSTAPGATPETQCFAYDGFRRLTEAWTPASRNRSDQRSAAALGGPAPYWTGYTYDDGGQRRTETEHTAAGDTTTTYCRTGTAEHAVTGTTTKGDCTAPEERAGAGGGTWVDERGFLGKTHDENSAAGSSRASGRAPGEAPWSSGPTGGSR